jgi:hypothetical protein
MDSQEANMKPKQTESDNKQSDHARNVKWKSKGLQEATVKENQTESGNKQEDQVPRHTLSLHGQDLYASGTTFSLTEYVNTKWDHARSVRNGVR